MGDQDVQLKYGSTQYCKTIDRPKYDGMQKVVPKEHSDPSKGWSDHIEVDGASRKPLSQKDAKSLVKNPDKAVDRLLPSDSVLESSVKTGLKAGAFGGGSGAFGGAVATAWARGNGEEIAKQALSGGFEGAVTSGLSSAAADGIANSTGDVSGTVGTILNVGRCSNRFDDESKRRACSLEEGAKGSYSTLTSVTATAVCSTFMGPFGFVCGAAAGLVPDGLSKADSIVCLKHATHAKCKGILGSPCFLT